MDELKTLKDEKVHLTIVCGVCHNKMYLTNIVQKEQLRQEAIKWIKHGRMKGYTFIAPEKSLPIEVISKMGGKLFDSGADMILMKFSNITEEDLK